MSDDVEYLKKYKPDHLYTHPGAKGAYATIAGESEEVVGEIDVTSRCKLAVSAFHVHDSRDFGTFKITKLQFHKTHGWREGGHIQVNQFQLAQIKEFLSIISSLDLGDAKKTRLSLDNLQVGALGTLLSSTKGAALISELAKSPELHQDIYAVAAKRAALAEFKEKLDAADEVAGAVTQIQKTTFEFARDHFRDDLKDEAGTWTGNIVYAVEPRSYLVVGNLAQIIGNRRQDHLLRTVSKEYSGTRNHYLR